MNLLHAARICLAVGALGAAGTLWAQDGSPLRPGQETLKLKLGGVILRNDDTVRIDGATRGTEFNLQDVLGVNRQPSTGFGSITWRFARRHRLSFSAFEISRDAQRQVSETIDLQDQVVPVNTTLRAETRTQFFTADYMYSFVKNDQLELAALVGVLGGRYKFRFTATSPIIDVDKSFTAPVPVLGLNLDYFISPRWTASAFGQGFRINVDNINSRIFQAGVSTEYMFTRHLGAGVSYQWTGMNLDVERGDFTGRVNTRRGMLFGYLQALF